MIAKPTVAVEVAFGAGANQNAWALGRTPFPVTLGAANVDVFTDVSADVRRLGVARGKNRARESYDPGRAVIDLDNRARDYDPLNLSGPYVSGGVTQVRPGRRVRITATHPTTLVEYDVFRGFIRDWGLDYGKFDAVARPSATDYLTDLARADVDLTTTAGLTGQAVASVLDDAGIAGYTVDDGSSTLQAATFTGTAQEAIRTLLDSEQGDLYVDERGGVLFKDRHSLISDSRSVTVQAAFGPAPLSIHAIDCAYESDLVRNSVKAQRAGGVVQTSEDTDSIRDYGKRSMSLTGLALPDDSSVLGLTQYLISQRKDPAVRIRSITITPQVSDELMTAALSLKLQDRVSVAFTPVGGVAIEQEVFIVGIEHTFAPESMRTVLRFEPTDRAIGWRLDTSRLDSTTVLAY